MNTPTMKHSIIPVSLVLFTSILLLGRVSAGPLETQITTEVFDPTVTAEWFEGQTDYDIEFHARRNTPAWIITTTSTLPGHGFRFGTHAENVGVRHFRVGFQWPVPIGTVLLGADEGMRLSLLKPDAPYPGELDNEDHWEELESAFGSDVQWFVPPEVVETRALRFTYETDEHAPAQPGVISGVYIFPERVANVAPQSVALASSQPHNAWRLADGQRYEWWDSWSNLSGRRPGEHKVSPERPELLTFIWPQERNLSALATFRTGFGKGEVQKYVGPEELHPREAGDEHWETIEAREFRLGHPSNFYPNWFFFESPISTRAIRIRITEAQDRSALDGTRVWMGELLALEKLGDRPVAEVMAPLDLEKPTAPIPVQFTLDQPGYVTLVIEDENGKRLRNLIAETWFEAGEHTVHWDGADESILRPLPTRTRDGRVMMGVHGLNETDGRIVKPGTYRVRGIVRDPIELRYQWTVGHSGSPPWSTPDGTGRWLADHSPPSDALYIPAGEHGEAQMMLSARVAEAGEGLIWTDLDGRRQRGIRWLGGTWTGAFFLARDEGAEAAPEVQAYTASTWDARASRTRGELRISKVFADGNSESILHHEFDHEGRGHDLLRGIAARDGVLYLPMRHLDKMVLVDAKEKKLLGQVPIDDPTGLAFDASGKLLAISRGRLVRFDLSSFQPGTSAALPEPEVVISEGLEAPVNLTLDSDGRIYIGDRGDAHTIKVFEPDGTFVREIGTPGGPQVGAYDETRIHNPAGLAVDGRDQLWVVEADFAPKRISVWTLDGKFLRAFYGPSQYGGGGTVDPKDPSRVYYAKQGRNSALEFHVDRETGESRVASVIYRPLEDDEIALPNFRGTERAATGPQWPIYVEGRQFMTNAFNSHPANGSRVVTIWQMKDGVTHPVVVAGDPRTWSLLKEERFAQVLPEGVDLSNSRSAQNLFFVWSDLNSDGQVQPEEVSFHKLSTPVGSIYVGEDLGLMTETTYRIGVAGFTEEGVPTYDLDGAKQVVVDEITTSGRGLYEAVDASARVILTGGPMRGYNADGELEWTYPNHWPSLHAGHRAPSRQQHPGQLIATTRVLGQPFRPQGTDVEILGINGDKGQIFLMTTDGFFVATLGAQADGPRWNMNRQEHGMSLNEVNFIGEHFWPSIIQPEEGPALLVAGKQHSSVVAVEGLDTIRRLPEGAVVVTEELVAEAGEYRRSLDLLRQQREGRAVLPVQLLDAPLEIDGKWEKWEDASWESIDDTHVEAAMAADREFLYLAYRTSISDLIKNSGTAPQMLFKTGGGLDLMIGADAGADPERADPVPGDQRLLLAEVGDEIRAVLYRPSVPGVDESDAVPFSSPWDTVYIDQVDDVSDRIQLAQEVWQRGNARFFFYEVAIPWELLDIEPEEGLRLSGDVGVLRGQGGETVQRLYWQNKSTNIVEDIPSEAMLTPSLWGIFEFQK